MTKIDDMLRTAEEQLGKPYVFGATGPDTFDCSGFTQFSYASVGVAIGRDTVAQWNNAKIVIDALNLSSQGPGGGNASSVANAASLLARGDLIFFGKSHSSGGAAAHVQIYMGVVNGIQQIIEAPHTGANVRVETLDLSGSADEPFAGIGRFIASDGNTILTSQNQLATDVVGSAVTISQNSLADPTAVYTSLQSGADIPDPRDNRPFDPHFFASTDLSFTTPWSGGVALSPGRELVHGGMAEILDTPRKGGPLACYFMLNPTSISSGYTFDASMPLATNLTPQAQAIASAPLTNISISFSLIFNRMYEVWMGNLPGPSDIGVRWDVRALERLAGLLDDTTNNKGISKWGPGQGAPVGQRIQVVFGGINSFQFQGILQGLDTTYTRFSRDMVPTEATVDIQMLITFVANQTADLSNNLLINFAPGTGSPTIPTVLFP